MICIYHSRDLDGWMSAAIVKYWYKAYITQKQQIEAEQNKGSFSDYPPLTLIGWDYGNEIPDLSKYQTIIMVDISFPKEKMRELGYKHSFVWIDHHISAINDSIENAYTIYNGIRNDKFAACELTWKYFFPDESMPEIVRLLGRYDCFGHKQVWRQVVGYEGIYEVSNHGNIRSLDRVITESNTGIKRPIKGMLLTPVISKRGYRVVVLCKEGTGKMYNVHHLVADAFIPNPENKPTVNHKDLNRLNNYVSNLEWATYLENNMHAINKGVRGKSVCQLNDDDLVIDVFGSMIQAENETGIQAQNIGKVCNGEREKAGGYRWEYGEIKQMVPQFVPTDEERKVLVFQYAARASLRNPDECYKALIDVKDEYIEGWLNVGEGIYSYLCTEARQKYDKKFEIWLDGKLFACVNDWRLNPINFGINYHADGYDGFACFWYENGQFSYSLYNDNGEVDCSVIAKNRGGGGHKGASGFRSEIIIK